MRTPDYLLYSRAITLQTQTRNRNDNRSSLRKRIKGCTNFSPRPPRVPFSVRATVFLTGLYRNYTLQTEILGCTGL